MSEETTYHSAVTVHEFGADWGVWQRDPTMDLGTGRVHIEDGIPTPEVAEATARSICEAIISETKKQEDRCHKHGVHFSIKDGVSFCAFCPSERDEPLCTRCGGEMWDSPPLCAHQMGWEEHTFCTTEPVDEDGRPTKGRREG